MTFYFVLIIILNTHLRLGTKIPNHTHPAYGSSHTASRTDTEARSTEVSTSVCYRKHAWYNSLATLLVADGRNRIAAHHHVAPRHAV